MKLDIDSKLLLRFWSKVKVSPDINKCWNWIPPKDDFGRGQFYYKGKPKRQHIVAFAISNNRFPELNVLHSCDNPSCANPTHLSEGTQADNIRQMHERGRARKAVGASASKAKLTADIVREIRSSSDTGTALAKRFGVTHQNIYRIRSNKVWRSVK